MVACQNNPSNVNLWTCLGRLQRERDEFDLAIVSFRKALQCSPLHCLAHTELGHCLESLGDRAGALSAYQIAVELEPTAGRWIYLGAAYEDAESSSEAEVCFLNALALEPNNEEAHFNLGVSYRLHQPAKAIDHLDQAVVIDPAYQQAFRERGFALGRLGRFDESIASLNRAIELKPDDYWCYLYLAAGYREMSPPEMNLALNAYQTACNLDGPGDGRPHFFLGKFLASLERHEDAIDAFLRALAFDDEYPGIRRELADSYEATGDWTNASRFRE